MAMSGERSITGSATFLGPDQFKLELVGMQTVATNTGELLGSRLGPLAP